MRTTEDMIDDGEGSSSYCSHRRQHIYDAFRRHSLVFAAFLACWGASHRVDGAVSSRATHDYFSPLSFRGGETVAATDVHNSTTTHVSCSSNATNIDFKLEVAPDLSRRVKSRKKKWRKASPDKDRPDDSDRQMMTGKKATSSKHAYQRAKAGRKSKTANISSSDNPVVEASIRRIRREWKDVVNMGIGYDWIKCETVTLRRSSRRRQRRSRGFGFEETCKNIDGLNETEHDAVTDEEPTSSEQIRIGPFGRNLLTWHFTYAGAPGSSFSGGLYHGRVILPRNYPGSPPRVQILTPSGRFIVGEDICLSASNYHPESWTPRWTVLGLVQALRLHMLTTANEIGGLNASEETRRRLAQESRNWRHPGLVDHATMISDGLFFASNISTGGVDHQEQKQSMDNAESKEQSASQRSISLKSRDGSVSENIPKKSADSSVIVQNPKRPLSMMAGVIVQAFFGVFVNPLHMSILIILTVFTILNRQ